MTDTPKEAAHVSFASSNFPETWEGKREQPRAPLGLQVQAILSVASPFPQSGSDAGHHHWPRQALRPPLSMVAICLMQRSVKDLTTKRYDVVEEGGKEQWR